MLAEKIARAEQIVTDQKRSQQQKNMELSKIMTDMEKQYRIPMMNDEKWNAAHTDIISTYRKISDMRSL